MKWKEDLINYYKSEILKNTTNNKFYSSENITPANVGVHLGIFSEPFLSLILNGTKTVESRFSINKKSPFETVKKGDVIFIKKAGGAVVGYFICGKAEFFSAPSQNNLNKIKITYGTEICSDAVKHFWEDRMEAKFISLLKVAVVRNILPFTIAKKDRTAWVTLRSASTNPKLDI